MCKATAVSVCQAKEKVAEQLNIPRNMCMQGRDIIHHVTHGHQLHIGSALHALA